MNKGGKVFVIEKERKDKIIEAIDWEGLAAFKLCRKNGNSSCFASLKILTEILKDF